MHEATRRILGVLLRHLDGFDSGGVDASDGPDGSGSGGSNSSSSGDSSGVSSGRRQRVVVIGATNRRQDLDPALLSRFTASVHFGLPSEACRCGARVWSV